MAKKIGKRELARRKRNQDWSRYKYLYKKRYEEAIKQGYNMRDVKPFPERPEGNLTKRDIERAKKSYRRIIDDAKNPLGDSWREAHKRGYDYEAKREEVYDEYMRSKYGEDYDEMLENQELTDLLPTEQVAMERANLFAETGYEYEGFTEAVIDSFASDVEKVYMAVEMIRPDRHTEHDEALDIFQQQIYTHYHDEEFAKTIVEGKEQGIIVTNYYMYDGSHAHEFFAELDAITKGYGDIQSSIDDLIDEMSNNTWHDDESFSTTDDYKLE